MQPTADQIKAAWTRAIECADIGGARAESQQELRRLYLAKTTWVGADEHRLLFGLRDYLTDVCGFSFGGGKCE